MIRISVMDIENKLQIPDFKFQIVDPEIAIISITRGGNELASRIQRFMPEATVFSVLPSINEFIREHWHKYRGFIFIMATGIVVRTIAPFIKDKKTDPAVVVIDEKCRFVISLLSGHVGGANELARRIAGHLGAEAVITTASGASGLPALDLWAIENDLIVEDWQAMTKASAKLVNNGALRLYSENKLNPLPEAFLRVENPAYADVIVTNKKSLSICGCHVKDTLYLRPKNLIIGIGCNRGTPAEEIEDMVKSSLEEYNLSFKSIRAIATIEQKKDEQGLLLFAQRYGFKIEVFRADELNSVKGIDVSKTAFKATGANAVAEPAAILGAGTSTLLIPKQKKGNVTLAVAELKSEHRAQSTEHRQGIQQKGKIYIVGTGPGNHQHITPAAVNAIKDADVIVGYKTYLDLLVEAYGYSHPMKGKEVIPSGMMQEAERCKEAIDIAMTGKTVAIISGGDPGIYAMAGLVFEMLKNETEKRGHGDTETKGQDTLKVSPFHRVSDSPYHTTIEVIPGIAALNASASRLGAPLMHDFASISLSDLLTPWDVIEKRLEAAASADFVIVLYNPKSKGRTEHIKRAMDIILKHRFPHTPVGIAKAAMRDNEEIIITNLEEMLNHEIDMQSTVIIGNSKTFVWEGWMVTPRGYKIGESVRMRR